MRWARGQTSDHCSRNPTATPRVLRGNERLRGRIGGRIQDKDLDLTLRGGEVDGRVGGVFAGWGVDGDVTPAGVRVRLTVRGEHVTGRFSGRLDGKDVDLYRRGDRLRGRIGGMTEGKDVDPTLGNVPLELAALAAVCAYRALEDEQTGAAATTAATS